MVLQPWLFKGAFKEPAKWNLWMDGAIELVEFNDLLLRVIFGVKGVPRRVNGVLV